MEDPSYALCRILKNTHHKECGASWMEKVLNKFSFINSFPFNVSFLYPLILSKTAGSLNFSGDIEMKSRRGMS